METREALKNFIETEIAAGATVAYDDDLLMTGLVNSLDVIRLVTFTQEQFGVTVPPEDVVIEPEPDVVTTIPQALAGNV
ncbi:MAG: phosphopantetheine-binding protein, partial [Chloroflexota bacterium]